MTLKTGERQQQFCDTFIFERNECSNKRVQSVVWEHFQVVWYDLVKSSTCEQQLSDCNNTSSAVISVCTLREVCSKNEIL